MLVGDWYHQTLRARSRGLLAWLEGVVIDNVRHVHSVAVTRTDDYDRLRCEVRLAWYGWFTLGLMHFLVYKNARRIVDLARPPKVIIDLVVL